MNTLPGLFIMIFTGIICQFQFAVSGQGIGKIPPKTMIPDGIYVDFSQVKSGKPVPFNKIVATKDYRYKDFIKDQLKEKQISFYDDQGEKHEIITDSLWGYVSEGIIYIRLGKVYNPLRITGRISYFLADITRTDTIKHNPLLYDPAFNSFYSMKDPPPDPFMLYNPVLNNYYPAYSFRNEPLLEPDKKIYLQLMLDFNTGNILECNIINLRFLIKNDDELYQEYKKLRYKKKRDLIIYYIRKFNDRNPLIIQENQND